MSTRIFLPGNCGRWVRRGGSIVLLPDGGFGAGGGMEGEVGGRRPPPRPRPPAAYTVCDFIHPNIDVAAQFALFGLLSRGPAARAAALTMLAHVRAGTLAGIFQEDQRVPALRARSLGGNWWTLIPKGVGSVCGVGAPPLIAFRKSLAKNRPALEAELLRVFPGCGLPPLPAPPPSGRACSRPPPPPKPVIVTERPELVVLPTALSLFAAAGSTTPAEGIVDVRNSGPGSLAWQANVSEPWLDVSPSFGTATRAPGPVTVRANPAGLAAGTYTGKVVFTAPTPTGSPQVVDVTLTVGAAPPPGRTGRCGAAKEVAGDSFTGVGSQRPLFRAGRTITVHVQNTGEFRALVRVSALKPVTGSLENELAPGERLFMPFSAGGLRPINWSVEVANLLGASTLTWFVCSEWAPGDPPD